VTQTVYGIALDKVGTATAGGRYWSTPSGLLRTVQDTEIPVDVDHRGGTVGQVIYIERTRGGQVWVVAHVNDDVTAETPVRVGTELRSVATPFYWSVSRLGSEKLGYVLDSVALTASPARITARPVTFRDGNAHMAAFTSVDRFERALLKRANEYHLRRHGDPLIVCDDSDETGTLDASSYTRTGRPANRERVRCAVFAVPPRFAADRSRSDARARASVGDGRARPTRSRATRNAAARTCSARRRRLASSDRMSTGVLERGYPPCYPRPRQPPDLQGCLSPTRGATGLVAMRFWLVS
jgi:hypothetical protein